MSNVVVVSGVQPTELCVCVYIYLFFFRFFFHVGYYRILSRVP